MSDSAIASVAATGQVCIRLKEIGVENRDAKWCRLVTYLMVKGRDADFREIAGYFADLGYEMTVVANKKAKRKQKRKQKNREDGHG